MYTVEDILKEKGTEVTTIGGSASVLQAATLMNEKKLGALLVLDDERVVGIFTERDLLRRVIAPRLDPATTTVNQAMTREVVTCQAGTPVNDARAIFKTRRIRHLPVLDEGHHPAGLISLGDVNAWKLDGQEVEIQHLHEYLYGMV